MLLGTHSRRPIPSGARQRPRRLEPRVGDDARARTRSASAARSTSAGRASPVPATNVGDPLGDDPVDHVGILSSSRAASSAERAAITGERRLGGRAARPSGSSQPREADQAAGLADDQLAGGGVDAAAAPQRHHAVEPRRRHLAQRGGDRAERPQPVGAVDQRVDRGRDPARIGGLDPEHLEPAVAAAALAERRVEPRAVEPGALAAPRPPLLGRPEVVHEPELDVGHRRAVGDGDRQRVVRRCRAWRSASRRSGR